MNKLKELKLTICQIIYIKFQIRVKIINMKSYQKNIIDIEKSIKFDP